MNINLSLALLGLVIAVSIGGLTLIIEKSATNIALAIMQTGSCT